MMVKTTIFLVFIGILTNCKSTTQRSISRLKTTENRISGDLEMMMDEIAWKGKITSPLISEPVTIIGAGPVGLWSGIIAVQEGYHPVRIIEKRTFYTRAQIFQLHEKTIEKMRETMGDSLVENLLEKRYITSETVEGEKIYRMSVRSLEETLSYYFNRLVGTEAAKLPNADFKSEILRGYSADIDGDIVKIVPNEADELYAETTDGTVIVVNGAKSKLLKTLKVGNHNISSNGALGMVVFDNDDGKIMGIESGQKGKIRGEPFNLITGDGAYSYIELTEGTFNNFQFGQGTYSPRKG